MAILRRRLFYAGRVQGVGFRMTARRLSSGFPISGYVRNLADGRVEIVVEGESVSLLDYLKALQREFGDMIQEVEEAQGPLDLETLEGFSIRY